MEILRRCSGIDNAKINVITISFIFFTIRKLKEQIFPHDSSRKKLLVANRKEHSKQKSVWHFWRRQKLNKAIDQVGLLHKTSQEYNMRKNLPRSRKKSNKDKAEDVYLYVHPPKVRFTFQ